MKSNINKFFESVQKGICHRGLHDQKRPENSRAAFEAALNRHLAFECDVHITADKKLVVVHDSELERVTHKKGIVEELTLEEIRKDYPLFLDGSDIMTLEELLELWGEKVPLVIELKVYKESRHNLTEAIRPVLEKINDKSKVVLISFNHEALMDLRDTDFNIGRLIGKDEFKHRKKLDFSLYDFLDCEYRTASFGTFKKYRKNGGKIMVWTVNTDFAYFSAERYADAMTFEIVHSGVADPSVEYTNKRLLNLVKDRKLALEKEAKEKGIWAMAGKVAILLAAIAAIMFIAYFVLQACGLTDIEKIREQLGDSIWTYFIIAGLQAFQVVFIPISNQIITIPALAAFPDNLWQVYFASWAGIEVGTIVLFLLGRFGGQKILTWILSDKKKVERASLFLKKGKFFYPLGMLIGFIPDDILTTLAGTAHYNFFYVFFVSLITRGICVAATVFGLGVLTRYWWGWLVIGVGALLLALVTIILIKKSKGHVPESIDEED